MVTLISSTVLSHSHVEVSASVSVKNPTSVSVKNPTSVSVKSPTSHKENVGKRYIDPNNPTDYHHLFLLSWLSRLSLYHLVCHWLSD